MLVEDKCALVDVADVAVFMPVRSSRREVTAELSLCAHEAKVPVIIEPSPIERAPQTAVRAWSVNADAVLEAIDEAVARSTRLAKGRRAVADVADIWL